jgi:hypothetical protein
LWWQNQLGQLSLAEVVILPRNTYRSFGNEGKKLRIEGNDRDEKQVHADRN